MSRPLDAVRRTLAIEADALRATRAAVDGAYAKAIGLLARCRGKVVVTGVGKSGHVAQKIAATLSSTGTPALYMHPAEALHGDVGLVEKRDLVLAIGKSGESSELSALLPVLRRVGVKVIAITAVPRSTLGKAAAAVLRTPVAREACPLDLAPTASTTAAMAVGDALAVALMELRGFTKERFALNHPSGQLGRRLTLRVSDAMRSGRDLPKVRASASLKSLIAEMTSKHAGAACVVDAKGKLAGLVTDNDLRRAFESGGVNGRTAADVMNRKPTAIRADRMAVEAVELMTDRERPFSVLPVVDARGRAVGLVQVHDLRKLGL
ncbi:MAG: KpsF/GutQ family sugar-phosphate isomerase [Elusimicrobiota bacterium]|nr:MAG: KpsF/GutQ family sugar-phosphate isomerase [Elusimicrobiota bacterium]